MKRSLNRPLMWRNSAAIVTARTGGGLVDPGRIEEMESDLTKVIEDFDREVDVEVLRRIKETGEHLFPVMIHSQLLRCRAGACAWAARICQDKLPPGFTLYGWHPRIPPRTSHTLGDPKTGAGGEQYILDLRLARDRENVVSSFDLCQASQGKAPCWRIFLPEG